MCLTQGGCSRNIWHINEQLGFTFCVALQKLDCRTVIRVVEEKPVEGLEGQEMRRAKFEAEEGARPVRK